MTDLEAFAGDGFLKIEGAAPRRAADAVRDKLWRQLGLSPDEPESWSAPVRWASDMAGTGPFDEVVRNQALAAALDDICGADGWVPRGSLGNIPVRFPVTPPTIAAGTSTPTRRGPTGRGPSPGARTPCCC